MLKQMSEQSSVAIENTVATSKGIAYSSSVRRHSVCIAQPAVGKYSETFLQVQADRLPADVSIIHWEGEVLPCLDGRPILSDSAAARAGRKIGRLCRREPWETEWTTAFKTVIRRCQPELVLAQYGPSGVKVLEACRATGTPLVVHFHGFDASRHDVLEQHEAAYREMFAYASAVIAVSQPMRDKLIELGAPKELVFINPYGVDPSKFGPAFPSENPPHLLAAGRFVAKKAPHLTLLAFSEAIKRCPEARLTFVGDGPLLPICREIADALEISHAVDFLGSQSHGAVAQLMRTSRAFVQHSVQASDGDCEGSPVAITEAAFSGLPVIATRHAGIPALVEDDTTGLLVDEHDVSGMTRHMLTVLTDEQLAGQMGAAGRLHMTSAYTLQHRIDALWSVMQSSIC